MSYLAAAYAAGVGASGDNRYAHLMTSDQQKEFRDTFEFFDVDKGGDVDNRELGLMFRQLRTHAIRRGGRADDRRL